MTTLNPCTFLSTTLSTRSAARTTSSVSFVPVVTSVSLTWSDCNAVILSVPQKTEASSIGIQTGRLTDDFVLSQCLFGEHLLHSDPIDNVAAIVESEKSALLGSLVYPQYTWLATGGKCNLTPHKTNALVNRTVVLFPDVDAYDEWKERARRLFLPKRVIVSDLLQRVATSEEREKKIDIGDWLIDALKQKSAPTDMDNDKAKPP